MCVLVFHSFADYFLSMKNLNKGKSEKNVLLIKKNNWGKKHLFTSIVIDCFGEIENGNVITRQENTKKRTSVKKTCLKTDHVNHYFDSLFWIWIGNTWCRKSTTEKRQTLLNKIYESWHSCTWKNTFFFSSLNHAYPSKSSSWKQVVSEFFFLLLILFVQLGSKSCSSTWDYHSQKQQQQCSWNIWERKTW